MQAAPPSPPLTASDPASRPVHGPRHGWPGRLGRVALVFGVLGAAVAFEVPLCPFALATGHPCPGCGRTRAGLALLSGDPARALAFHPLSPLVVPLVALLVGANAAAYVLRGRWAVVEGLRGKRVTIAALALGALLLGVWIARFLGAFGGPVPV